MDTFEVKAGLRFGDRAVSFHVLNETAGKPGYWDVRESIPGAGFMRTRPIVKPMSESQIVKLVGNHTVASAFKEMSRSGMPSNLGIRPRYRDGNGLRMRKVSPLTAAKKSSMEHIRKWFEASKKPHVEVT